MLDSTDNFAVYNFPQVQQSIIKVIGVGGGGGNAVNHMYNEGIHDVTFVVCNTDNKALGDSPVPSKIQLGSEGLGAGNDPEYARKATEESIDDVRNMFCDGTKMAFITAGMGGGTGTGASPLIAKTAKDMGILTVGIVTIPFRWEGDMKIDQALDGVEAIGKNVDALLVVNNERLLQIYQDDTLDNAFAKANDILCNAAKSISEIITMHGTINLDFRDVQTVLKDGGVAIMSTGYGKGDGRVTRAIEDALHSPLLNDNDIYHAKKILLHLIHSGSKGEDVCPLMMEEMREVNEFMRQIKTKNVVTKWGYSADPSLKDTVKVTILASGFGFKGNVSSEMDARLDRQDEEARRQAQEVAEKEAENADRREIFYGPSSKNGYMPKPIYSFIFRDEDLDNEDVISNVESSHTYKRRKGTTDKFRPNVETAETSSVAGETIDFHIVG